MPALAQVRGDMRVRKLFVSALTSAPGNLISVMENSTGSFTPSCANSGVANTLTLIDTNNGAGSQAWTLCNGTSSMFVLPNVGSSVAATGQVLYGTGTGTASWQTVAGFASQFTEMDGSPDVTSVVQVKVPNGSLVDEGGGVVHIDTSFWPPYQTGRYYDQATVGWGHDTTGSGSSEGTVFSANLIYYVPFYVAHRTRFDRIAVHANANDGSWTGGNIKVGIYTPDANGLPGTRLVDGSGSPLVVAANVASDYSLSFGPSWFNPGLYWLAMLSDVGTPSDTIPLGAYGFSTQTSLFGYTSADSTETGSGAGTHYKESMTYASGLPATATPVIGTDSNVPRILLRALVP